MTDEAAEAASPPLVRPLPLLALVAVVVAVYLPSARNEFVYDDFEVIVNQAAPRTFADTARIFAEPHIFNLPYYRPIVRASLLLQKSAFGERPAPLRIANVGIMAAIAALALLLLRLPVFGLRPAAAWLAALGFALHPIASSCVYPIASGRETALPALFMLGCVYGYLRGGRLGRGSAYVAFGLSLLCKEQAVVLPAILLGADALRITPDGRRPVLADLRYWLVRAAPLLAIGVGYLLLRFALFGGSELRAGSWLGPLSSLAYAVQTLVAPQPQLVYEPAFSVWWAPWRLAFCAAVFAGIAFGFGRGGGTAKQLGFWSGWFVFIQLPTSNLLFQEAQFAERYAFLAALGPLAVGAGALSGLQGRAWRLGFSAAVVLIATWGGISLHRAEYFLDNQRFYEQWVSAAPDALSPRVNLGQLWLGRGEFSKAREQMEVAVRLGPNVPDAWSGLGQAQAAAGESEAALASYRRALAIDPQHGRSLYLLGVQAAARGRFDRAISHYRASLVQRPNEVNTHHNLGVALKREGEIDAAIAAWQRALELRPQHVASRYNLANTLAQAGRPEAAIPHYLRVLELDPEHASARESLAVAERMASDRARGH
jgi:tetratricopeptide (TPR) repeat protein